jgi:ABC-type amino acid transport substrate-binding protein
MKKFTALMLALMMSLSLVACGNKTDDSNNADDTNTDNNTEQTGGKLVLGTSADYAPYEFMYADDSGTMQYAGIDISAGQYIADELGMELQVENMSFDYLLTSLAKGDFDIVMAAIEVTPERLQSADFSDPYYTDLPAMILVKADAADQYNTLADFAGKSVGAQTATTKEAIVTDQMEGANLVSLSLVTDLVNELVYGKVDAIVVDGAVAEQYAESNPDLVVAAASSELGEAQPYCIAVAKGDPKGLLPGINEAIAKMTSENKMEEFIAAADELSGKAVQLIKRYALEQPWAEIHVKIDCDGLGVGVFDRLMELREQIVEEVQAQRDRRYADDEDAPPPFSLDIVECHFGGEGGTISDDDPIDYQNSTGLMWGAVREALRTQSIKLYPDDKQISQLSNRKYVVNSAGKIELEKKEAMKKRGLSSPDMGDALALALHDPLVSDWSID